MAAQTLTPAPGSRREKIYEGLAWLSGNFALMGSTLIGRESGFWPSILVMIVLTLPGTLFFAGLAMQERKARLSGHLERGPCRFEAGDGRDLTSSRCGRPGTSSADRCWPWEVGIDSPEGGAGPRNSPSERGEPTLLAARRTFSGPPV